METEGIAEQSNQIDTPEALFKNFKEKPMSNEVAGNLNNKAVELFTKGKLNQEQLATFSVDLTNSADKWANTALKSIKERYVNELPSKIIIPEINNIDHARHIAAECRNRAVGITMAKSPSK